MNGKMKAINIIFLSCLVLIFSMGCDKKKVLYIETETEAEAGAPAAAAAEDSASTSSFGDLVMSYMHRTLGTEQISLATEISSTSLPSGYREVPDINLDDDGVLGNVTLATTPSTPCGESQASVEGRIAECASLNGAAATWDGNAKGHGGEASWKLVTFTTNSNKEVWRDERTKLLWSEQVANDNWCRAVGNGQNDDPSSVCNTGPYQSQLPLIESYCVESGRIAALGTEDFSTGAYSEVKGEMGLIGNATRPSVRWRAPTMSDLEQANIDGIRFVHPQMQRAGVPDVLFWSSTITSQYRTHAVLFNGSPQDKNTFLGLENGAASRDSNNRIICVGR